MESANIGRLHAVVNVPEADLNLLEAALAIAEAEYPGLDPQRYRRRLARWARELRTRIAEDASAEQRLRTLNAFLFGELGFAGNMDDYYDPRNSYLNEVLDRRLGIPVTLSLIYMELGRRIGLPLEGVSFPGHFLVKLPVQDGAVVLDPFNGGVSLAEEDLYELIERMFDTEVDELGPLLSTAGKREILIRLLRNLKGIYQQTDQFDKALRMVNMMLTVDPGLHKERRDRGLLLLELECNRAAARDLAAYLTACPEAQDAEPIRELLVDLQHREPALH